MFSCSFLVRVYRPEGTTSVFWVISLRHTTVISGESALEFSSTAVMDFETSGEIFDEDVATQYMIEQSLQANNKQTEFKDILSADGCR